MASPIRPQLVSPRAAETLDMVRAVAGDQRFDPDVWHVMEERDNQLIADEVLYGVGSSSFVYQFDITPGKAVTGISVVGARHLAAHYRGLKHRLVASQQKIGELFTFTSYPAENMPMSVSCAVVHELSAEPDFYGAVIEISDIKTGNSIQIERRELRFENRRGDGGQYERPNYATIAQSKAYRNGVLALVPQDVQIEFKEKMLKLKKGETITLSVIDEKRGNVTRYAAKLAIPIDRRRLELLTLDQISGLGDAAREGNQAAFTSAATALGLTVAAEPQIEQQRTTPEPPRRSRARREASPPPPPPHEDTRQPDAGAPPASPPPPPSTERRMPQFEV